MKNVQNNYSTMQISFILYITHENQENVETRKLNNCIKSLIIKNKYVKIQNYLFSTQRKFVIFISISLPFNYFVYSFDGKRHLKLKIDPIYFWMLVVVSKTF